jgi:hypothetical protein
MRSLISLSLLVLISPLLAESAFGQSPPPACVASCVDVANGARPLLDGEFATFIGRAQFEGACLANPKGKDLFPTDHDRQSVRKRLDAYCKYSPDFRLCFVCERLKSDKAEASKKTTLRNSLDTCRGLLGDQSYDVFLKDVVKPNSSESHDDTETKIAPAG